MISSQLTTLQKNIDTICRRCDHNPDDVVLIGVTKYTDVSFVNEALDAGLQHIGENRVQDAVKKFEKLSSGSSVKKHLIGHLQSNKVKPAVAAFDMIQSVDSIKLVRSIEKYAARLNKLVDVLIQVNVSGEKQKSGCAPEEADHIIEVASECPHVRVKGLMTMAPMTEDKQLVRDCFGGLKVLFDQLAKEWTGSQHVEMKYLSMGMSGDYEIALEEGANMVRIGSAIFKS